MRKSKIKMMNQKLKKHNNRFMSFLQITIALGLIFLGSVMTINFLETAISPDNHINKENVVLIIFLRTVMILGGLSLIFWTKYRDRIIRFIKSFYVEEIVFIHIISFILLAVIFNVFTRGTIFQDYFNFDTESNFPAWLSGTLLAAAGILAIIIASASKEKKHNKHFMLVLALGFLYLSLDEITQLHEILSWYSPWKWYVVMAPIIIIWIILILFLAIKSLIKTEILWIIFTGIGILGIGSMGLEFISVNFIGNHNSLVYTAEVLLEETFEMFGTSLVILGLIRHLRVK
ncbi:MAG: Membrane protein [archaeon GW2011_AR3]|nr:MAG: Membrane protein [archaeon GW2011_AR3]MBS3109967.1 hypothetical protein [Candidatus Woesearchaeota archaeon]